MNRILLIAIIFLLFQSGRSQSAQETYQETLILKPGWNWLSFPRTERYKDETFDAITLLERIEPWLFIDLYMETYNPIFGLTSILHNEESGWNISGELTEVQSSQGYRLNYEPNIPDFSLRLEGAKLDYETEIDLFEGENWVGYFIDKSMDPEQCIPPEVWEVLTQIKTQYWTMTKKPFSDPPWFLEGKKAPFEYGDLVILKTSAPYEGFQWQTGGEEAEATEIPQAVFYTFEEQADYIPFYIETDSTSEIQEIAIVADGVVQGAAVRTPGDTLVEVNAYLEGVAPGAVIEFETWNGYKSNAVEKGAYVVFDHLRNTCEKRNIFASENADFYHVSFKSSEVYNLPPDLGPVSCQPNPFSQNAEFNFRLNQAGDIDFIIFDMGGNPVKTIISGNYPEGYYRFTWQGDNDTGNRISPGVYFYKISTDKGTLQTDKIVLIK